MRRAGQDYYLHADHQGSIVRVTDSAGAVVNSYAYDAYGRRLAATEGVALPYGYTGREFDAESGLMYYRARMYDPATGRFLQTDPIGFAAGDLNLYRYVFNNPVNATDPGGLETYQVTIIEGEAFGVGGTSLGGGASYGLYFDSFESLVSLNPAGDFVEGRAGFGSDIGFNVGVSVAGGRSYDTQGFGFEFEYDVNRFFTVEGGVTASGQPFGGIETGINVRRAGSISVNYTDLEPGGRRYRRVFDLLEQYGVTPTVPGGPPLDNSSLTQAFLDIFRTVFGCGGV